MPRPLAIVAEDEVLIRIDAADMLGDLGFDVLEAGCAAAALRHLEACDGAALLYTDVNMPGAMDGCELARTVVRRWPDTAIIVCSACLPKVAAALPDRARFIGKPCGEALVRQALEALRLHRELARPVFQS